LIISVVNAYFIADVSVSVTVFLFVETEYHLVSYDALSSDCHEKSQPVLCLVHD